MTVQIVFSPEEAGKRGAMYFPDNRVIEIYRSGLAESAVEQVAGVAALADDPMTELLFLAHELGHHNTVLFSLGTGRFDASDPDATYTEEVWAWRFARKLLAARDCRWLAALDLKAKQELEGYREGLQISRELAMAIEERVDARLAEFTCAG
ncbi:MAG: hypothetical protein QM756_36225 [Polyangiaceae bacterium]